MRTARTKLEIGKRRHAWSDGISRFGFVGDCSRGLPAVAAEISAPRQHVSQERGYATAPLGWDTSPERAESKLLQALNSVLLIIDRLAKERIDSLPSQTLLLGVALRTFASFPRTENFSQLWPGGPN